MKRCFVIATSPNPVDVCIPPTIVTQPQSVQVQDGDSVSLFAVFSGTSPLQYQWQKNNIDIEGANAGVFSIIYAADSDAGSYRVIGTNKCGSVESNVALVVVNSSGACVPPFITSNPSGESVVVNDSVTFNTVATGTGPLNYQWQKNGINIAGATSSSLAIVYAQLSDQGAYHCIVVNDCGFAVTQLAILTVHTPSSGGGGSSFTGNLG